MNFRFFTLIGLTSALSGLAAEPAGYYSQCENKSGANLLKALETVVGPHTTISYDGLLDLYRTSDVYPDGTIWDMYSTKHWSPSNTCGNYKLVGDCYNREHSFPKSWFNDAKPMYSDAYHLYPTDGKVNGQRSNYPYGECSGGTRLPSSGGVQALGRLGSCTFPGYTGTVFEPDDEYKGDFARSYFYMAAAYNSKIGSWSSPMLAGNAYPAFSGWSVQLLLKWHRQDPVSQKELDRNEVVYRNQRNRNPFIDHPELAEYVWGDQKSQPWTSTAGSQPQWNTPVDGSKVAFGTTAVGHPVSTTVVVRGTNLQSNVTASVTGDFTLSSTSLPASSVNSSTGYTLTITYLANATGAAQGRLALRSGDQGATVALEAEAVTGLPASRPADISDCGFVARWTYIGDAFADGSYRIYILDSEDEEPIPGYPKAVNATAGVYEIDDLDASTTYTYYLQSQSMESTRFAVTTADPIPAIEFYYDGDLFLESSPGVPSEVAELDVVIENIATDVTVSVSAPFEVSVDRSEWATDAVLPVGADRLYLRLNGDTPGDYTTHLRARAGDFLADNAVVSGHIGALIALFEDFEEPGTGSYSAHTYQGTGALWNLSDAGQWKGDPVHTGTYAIRAGKSGKGLIEMAEDTRDGIGTVTVYARRYGADGEAVVALEISTDGGSSWQEVSSATITSTAFEPLTFTVNRAGTVRMRLRQLSGKRWLCDDIEATTYRSSSVADAPSGYRLWDAFGSHGSLTVRLSEASQVLIYTVSGIICHSGILPEGDTLLDLAPGLYIVAVDGLTRRVVL